MLLIEIESEEILSQDSWLANSNGHDDGDDEGHGPHGGTGGGTGVGTAEITKTRTEKPSMYKVLLLNDDFTPMDFVIHVLQKFFNKEYTEATRIMLQVHQQGAGLAGVFSYEIAETKVFQVNQYSTANQHPLKCTMESE